MEGISFCARQTICDGREESLRVRDCFSKYSEKSIGFLVLHLLNPSFAQRWSIGWGIRIKQHVVCSWVRPWATNRICLNHNPPPPYLVWHPITAKRCRPATANTISVAFNNQEGMLGWPLRAYKTDRECHTSGGGEKESWVEGGKE